MMPFRFQPMKSVSTYCLLATAVLGISGCGSSAPSPVASGNGAAAPAPATNGTPQVAEATNTVAQFLDAVRRGGETGGANQLLTSHAQEVLTQMGRTVQPIGSPDAVFTVTRAEAVPDTPGAALVHSLWTEPVPGGTTKESYQVVWALEHEASGWRISGLAMDLEPGQEPMVVDFENATQMAALLNATEATPAVGGSDAVSQAAAPGTNVQR